MKSNQRFLIDIDVGHLAGIDRLALHSFAPFQRQFVRNGFDESPQRVAGRNSIQRSLKSFQVVIQILFCLAFFRIQFGRFEMEAS